MALPEQLSRIVPLIKGLGALGVVGGLAYNSFFVVPAGERAVMFNRVQGVKRTVLSEGLKFKIPWFEWPILYSTRTQPRELSHTLAGTRDLQYVKISLRIVFEPVVDRLWETVSKYGEDYDRRILPSLMHETLKGVVAQYTAEQLTTQREEVSRRIRMHLTERATDFNIKIRDCAITTMDFGKDFKAATEAKQVAQQEAERARYEVERAEQEKLAKIIEAEGEAQAMKNVGAMMKKSRVYADLKRIDAALDIADALSNSRNRIFLSSDSLLVNLMSEFGSKGE